MIVILYFLVGLSTKQISNEPIFFEPTSDVYARNLLFISTDCGIFTFDRNSRTWGRISVANGLPDNEIQSIGIDEGILWVITKKGLASADIKINDWQVYEQVGLVNGIDFDEEYVWVGSDSGLWRYNKYSEIWEKVIEIGVNFLYMERDYIWLGTPDGILRYNRKFEKIEEIPNTPVDSIYYIVSTANIIWFLGKNRFISYKRNKEVWNEYQGSIVNDYSTLGDSLFCLSQGRVSFYNPKTDNWEFFKEFEVVRNINGISVNQKKILFATNGGIVSYDWNDKSREVYTKNNGLVSDTVIDVYENNDFIFAVSASNIQFFNKSEGVWQVEKIIPSVKPRESFIYYDDVGLHTRIINNTDIRLQGNAYYQLTYRKSGDVVDTTTWENINLKLVGEHISKRLLSMYYDDTDKEQVAYGFGYRGLENDGLYRLNGGYLRTEYSDFNILPQFSVLGGNAKLKYKNHNLFLQAGEIKSGMNRDYFFGKKYYHVDTIFDVDYQKYQFYYIYSYPRTIPKDYDTIFIDDRMSSTNTIKTRMGMTIAGITGDYDIFINGVDYFVDYERGFIHFVAPRRSTDIIIMLINGVEIIIQSDTVKDKMRENIYFIGPGIIPNSISLTITDTLGQVQPLNIFGIDNDNNNIIDPEFINCELGYLIFPASRPFPDEVYDDTIHLYSMIFEFQTYLTFYRLSKYPVLIGSEKVFVDGEQMARGSQYILDYTSGIIFFLSEELISDFSEIEVEYMQVQRMRKDIYYAVQPNIVFNDNLNIAPGYSNIIDQQIFHLSGNLYSQITEDGSIKFNPQAAVNSEKEYAQIHNLVANYHIISINSEYQSFSQNFESFGNNTGKYGSLRQQGVLGIGICPLSYLRFDGKFDKQYQIDSANIQKKIEYWYGKVYYLYPGLPNGYILWGKDFLPEYDKTKFAINANYKAEYKKTKFKFNSNFNKQSIISNEIGRFKSLIYLFESNLLLPLPININLFVKNGNIYDDITKEKNEKTERCNLSIDVIPGIYYEGNYELKTVDYYLLNSKDLSIFNYFYNNMIVAPGRWLKNLTLINLSFGLGKNTGQYLKDLPPDYKIPFIFIKPIEDSNISSINTTNSIYATIQLTPLTSLYLWFRETYNQTTYVYYSIPEPVPTYIDECKLEYEHINLGFFRSAFTRKRYYNYPQKILNNIYFDWNKPFSNLLNVKVIANHKLEKNIYGHIDTYEKETRIGEETLFRFGSKNFFTLGFSTTRKTDILNNINYYLTPGGSFNLNLIKFLFFQGNYEMNIQINGLVNHTLTAKLSGQF